MNWIEEVQGALQELKLDCEECGAPDEHEIEQARGHGWSLDIGRTWALCEKALAAIPAEPEMMRLLKWLRMRLLSSTEAAENILGKRDIIWTKDIPKTVKLLAEYGLRQEDCRLLVEVIRYVEMLGYKSEDDDDYGQENDSSPQA